jgi:hypothetical protein
MVARRVIENWLYWVVVDAVAAWLYFTQGLLATTLLFVIYLGIVVRGYFVWRREQAQATAGGSRCVMQPSSEAPAQVAAIALESGHRRDPRGRADQARSHESQLARHDRR